MFIRLLTRSTGQATGVACDWRKSADVAGGKPTRSIRWWLSASIAWLLSTHVATADDVAPPDTTLVKLDEIVVTASRPERASGDLPASVTVLGRESLRRAPSQTVDDVLREIPGFTLFRRTPSLTAHPTTQGVSLRGVGASGASRTLVLLDGMPVNDAFGGWVQWARVPAFGIDRIEVLRGGAAHSWGNYALSGVVNLVTARRPGFEWSLRAGTHRTIGADVAYAGRTDRSTWRVSGGLLDTGGYDAVAADHRGAIDEHVASRAATGRAVVTVDLNRATTLTLHGGAFADTRDNGTPLTGNETRSGWVGAGIRHERPTGAVLQTDLFGQATRFSSTFSAQAADRSTESPALDQHRVPSRAAGLSATVRLPVASDHLLAFGGDIRALDGETNERFFFRDGDFVRSRKAGGNQQVVGGFGQAVLFVGRQVEWTVGARVDRWRSSDGFRRETDRTSGNVTRDETYATETRSAFSPRTGIRVRTSETASIRAAAYRTFRSPTLNELYRPFRVGNVITAANASLDGERLTGVETGADLRGDRRSASVTAYWNEIDGSVANLLIGEGPGSVDPCGFVPNGGLCRQRTNLDRVRVIGFEAEAEARSPRLAASAAYLFTRATVRRASDASLVDRRLPQIPEHSAVFRLTVADGRGTSATARVRLVGNQFEDASNALPLDAFGLLDLIVRRKVGTKKEVFLQAENLLNTSYSVGISATGLRTVGPPLRLTAGIRTTL